jgi:2-polyprenyl-3-methyl-5-hydroxy-6-metoxy-1,4-benzoquinol methylase
LSHPIFDEAATDFARNLDDAIAANTYFRGRLFVDAVRREVPRGARVLDYGCGPGRIARLIAEAGYQVDGSDPSPMMIAEAEKQPVAGSRPTFRVNDRNGDDLESDAYAGIVCSSVIEFVPDAEGLLTNFRRALRPDGALIFSYSNKHSFWRIYANRRYYRRLRHLTVQCHVWSLPEMKAALRRAGLKMCSHPVFFDAAPFDRRPRLRFLSSLPFVGTLGLVVARRGTKTE